MNKEQLYEVLGDINETYVNDAHMTTKKKPHPVWIKWAAMAACFCLLLTAVIATPRLCEQPTNIDQPNTSNPQNISQYVPSYSSPELESLYKEDPYSMLLPNKIPETFAFASSYKTEYDPIANPNSEQYLWLGFNSEQLKSSIEIKVMEYDGKGAITEPAEMDTYDLSLYYDHLKTPGAVGADAPNVLTALFRAEDLSVSIVEKRMYAFDDGLCKAEIQILCGDQIVGYHYAGIEISPQSLYEVITSSYYFLEMSDVDLNSEDEQSMQGITDEILNGTLDGGANIALDAKTATEEDSETPENMKGVLDGGADIELDAAP